MTVQRRNYRLSSPTECTLEVGQVLIILDLNYVRLLTKVDFLAGFLAGLGSLTTITRSLFHWFVFGRRHLTTFIIFFAEDYFSVKSFFNCLLYCNKSTKIES